MLLAGDFDATILHDAEWVVAAVLGAVFGRMRGWTLPFDIDRDARPGTSASVVDTHFAAIGLVVLAASTSPRRASRSPSCRPNYVAAGAALLAGYIGSRALSITVRARRMAHLTPSSTPAETSLPPS